MASSSATRPATSAAFKQFQNGNTSKNLNNCKEWIQQQGLKRSQIIAITANESEVPEGDQILTLFYRERSVVDGDMPLDDIQVNSGNQRNSWEQQLVDINNFKVNGTTPEILAVSRTPKNIGNVRCQTIWHTSNQGHIQTFCTTMSRGDADWDQLSTNVHDWLNTHIAPHQLISVTFHEESHPNTSRCVAAVICHTAGPSPGKLSDSPAKEAVPMAGIYTMNTYRNDDTNVVVNQVLSCINVRGGQEGHVVTTCNDSQKEQIFAAVFSWSPILESQLQENMRPTGCAGCTIF